MENVTRKPRYQLIDGIRCPAMFSPKCFREALQYKPRSDDLFIVTYPKCGTTWLQSIVIHIFRKGKQMEHVKDLFTLSPFIDMLGTDGVSRMPRPGAIKTHLPYTHIPYSSDAKYIFVVRNPKDCCVSLYHHTRTLPGLDYADGKFNEFFELFITGEVEYNDYFDHLLSWYPHRNNKNHFYITYENMKKDPKGAVLRIAEFLGEEYQYTMVHDNNVMNNVLHYSSFEYMKDKFSMIYDQRVLENNVVKDRDSPEGIQFLYNYVNSLNLSKDRPKVEFVRKGIVGDWKNYLSKEQDERVIRKLIEKTKGTDIYSWFFN